MHLRILKTAYHQGGCLGRQLTPLPCRAASTASAKESVQQNGSQNSSSETIDLELHNAKPFADIPGVKGIWNSLHFMKDFFPVLGKYSKEPVRLPDLHMKRCLLYGKIHRIDLITGMKLVFICDPEDIRRVSQNEGKRPVRHILEGLKRYRHSKPEMYKTSGILTENGETWYNTRSKVQVPMLRPNIVETYIPSMTAISKDFVERMKKLRDEQGEIPDLLNELYKWALESIGLVAFNNRLGCLADNLSADSQAQQMIQAVSETLDGATDMEFGLQLWRIFPSASYRKLAKAQDFIRSVAVKYCNRTLERIKQLGEDDGDTGGILGKLAKKEDLDQRELFTFMLDLLQAGVDTTSHSMGFTLYLLARNPEVQAKTYEEIRKLVPTPDTPITAQTLNGMQYLKAVVKEAMRMMSVTEGTTRVLDHDIVLSGFRIPAGVTVVTLSQTAARLPEYFEQPDKFMPERWLQTTKPNPYTNLPFGLGPRTCIGRRIALQEMYLLLVPMLLNYRIEYHYEDISRVTRFISMPDKPLKFTFIERK